jgi:hypothetical protein
VVPKALVQKYSLVSVGNLWCESYNDNATSIETIQLRIGVPKLRSDTLDLLMSLWFVVQSILRYG